MTQLAKAQSAPYTDATSVANIEPLGVARAAGSAVPVRSRAIPALRDLVALTKPRITSLVLLTGAAGMCLAPGHVPSQKAMLSLAGTALIVGSANALNMWWERDVDARMMRTRNRPLPSGRMSPEVALAFGLGLALVASPMLFAVNAATGLLGLVALVSYVAVYTPLKRHTHLALLVGAVPGAMPPLLGWSTATGTVGAGGLLLFGVMFLWQVPHFAAISIFRAEDYARAGLQVVSVQHGERAARQMIAVYAVLLVAASFLFVPFGLAGRRYAVIATLLDAAFLALALRGLRAGPAHFDARRWAKHVFAFSMPYLTVLLVALLSDRGSQ
ncbi:MAG TPA: heme o synthase [Polyangiaceae bacterium]|nr:heme o synthase [Polyangiaceae bacterium]